MSADPLPSPRFRWRLYAKSEALRGSFLAGFHDRQAVVVGVHHPRRAVAAGFLLVVPGALVIGDALALEVVEAEALGLGDDLVGSVRCV